MLTLNRWFYFKNKFSGRIDRKIEFPPPNEEARLDILKIHSRKMNLTRGINLRKIAEMMPGSSGAEVNDVTQRVGVVTIVIVPLLLPTLFGVFSPVPLYRGYFIPSHFYKSLKVLVKGNQCLLAQTHRSLTRSPITFSIRFSSPLQTRLTLKTVGFVFLWQVKKSQLFQSRVKILQL